MFRENDGGRADAGYTPKAHDCVVRASAIITGESYKAVYQEYYHILKNSNRKTVAAAAARGSPSPRWGVPLFALREFLLKRRGYKYAAMRNRSVSFTYGGIARAFGNCTALILTRVHCCAVLGGVLNDVQAWNVDTAKKVYAIYLPPGEKIHGVKLTCETHTV